MEENAIQQLLGDNNASLVEEDNPCTVVKVVEEQSDEKTLHKAKVESALRALTRYFRKMEKDVFLKGGQLA